MTKEQRDTIEKAMRSKANIARYYRNEASEFRKLGLNNIAAERERLADERERQSADYGAMLASMLTVDLVAR